jgi:hypothetical protein
VDLRFSYDRTYAERYALGDLIFEGAPYLHGTFSISGYLKSYDGTTAGVGTTPANYKSNNPNVDVTFTATVSGNTLTVGGLTGENAVYNGTYKKYTYTGY